MLRDRHPAMRLAAANALGGIGAAAKLAVPALVRATKDVSVQVRAAAALAIEQISGMR